MNTLTLKDLPDDLASGNSLLSMVMQLSMSIVTIAGLLLGTVWPTAYESRRRQHPSGLSLHLSEHGGDHRPAGAHFCQAG